MRCNDNLETFSSWMYTFCQLNKKNYVIPVKDANTGSSTITDHQSQSRAPGQIRSNLCTKMVITWSNIDRFSWKLVSNLILSNWTTLLLFICAKKCFEVCTFSHYHIVRKICQFKSFFLHIWTKANLFSLIRLGYWPIFSWIGQYLTMLWPFLCSNMTGGRALYDLRPPAASNRTPFWL